MPMVTAHIGEGFLEHPKDLYYICAEMVPAALHSEQGPLKPGEIEYVALRVDYGMNANVVITIEATALEDRKVNKQERADAIKQYLEKFFPNSTFIVFLKLVDGAWSLDDTEDTCDVDMSLEAAEQRAITDREAYLSKQLSVSRSGRQPRPRMAVPS